MNSPPQPQPASLQRGWVFYDGACPMCTGLARRCKRLLTRRGYVLVPLQSLGAVERLPLSPSELLREMRVLTTTGEFLGGADALLHLSRAIWWARPVAWLGCLPGMRDRLRRAYRVVARRRHGIRGACAIKHPSRWSVWLAMIALLLGAATLRSRLPAWGVMWLLAFTIYLSCKWLTWTRALRDGGFPDRGRSLGCLFAWPGMDPRPFQCRLAQAMRPGLISLPATGLRAVVGVALFWLAARQLGPEHLVATGWVGMIGLLLILHFGCFELLALAWRRAGVDVRSLMQAPLRAESLSDFWSVHWNSAFRDLAHRFVFRPTVGLAGVTAATLATYLVSGLVHELVISLPARAGYGLPTGYFLLQGTCVLLEHSRLGRRLHLGRGLAGRLFALACVALPAYWLFHRPFVVNVFVPFMRALGALG